MTQATKDDDEPLTPFYPVVTPASKAPRWRDHQMSNHITANAHWRCYAKANGKDPGAMLVLDQEKWPNGPMMGFTIWLHWQWEAFEKELGFRPAIYLAADLTDRKIHAERDRLMWRACYQFEFLSWLKTEIQYAQEGGGG